MYILGKTKMIIILLGVVFITSSLQADTTNSAADYLVKIGVRSLEKGQKDTAISDFSKALMLDSENTEALAHLNELGISKGLYGPQKTSLVEITNLASQVKEYEKDVFQLEVENEKIKERITKVKDQRDSLYHSNVMKAVEVDALSKEIEDVRINLVSQDQTHQQKLEDIQTYYDQEKMKLLTQLSENQNRLNTEVVSSRQRNKMIEMYGDTARRNVKQAREFQKKLVSVHGDYRELENKSDIVKDNYFQTLNDVDQILVSNDQGINSLEQRIFDQKIQLIEQKSYANQYFEELRDSLDSINKYKSELSQELSSLREENGNVEKYIVAIKDTQENLQQIETLIQKLIDQKSKVIN
jgi:chromosome segregation ATPase